MVKRRNANEENHDELEKFTAIDLHGIVGCDEKDEVIRPVHFCTALLGLNDGCMRRWKIQCKIYNATVILVLICTAVRRICQIGVREPGTKPLGWQVAMFDPTVVLTFCSALFYFCGATAALVLHSLNQKSHEFIKFVGPLLQHSDETNNVSKKKKVVRLLLAYAFTISLFAAIVSAVYHIPSKAMNLPYLPPLLGDNWYFYIFEVYTVFLSQAAISLLAIFFVLTCLIIRSGIRNLLREMNPPALLRDVLKDYSQLSIHDTPQFSSQESLLRIRLAQRHLQQIIKAKSVVEKNFAFVLFYSFGCAIPLICFLGYLIIKNMDQYWALHFSLGMWIFKTISVLLCFSYPAFLMSEEGDKLLGAAYTMYHELLCGGTDPVVVSHMSLLVFQIYSANFTLSASNYFSLNRKILLSLASAIFTYFLILVQFGEAGETSTL